MAIQKRLNSTEYRRSLQRVRRATPVAKSGALGRPHRSVLVFDNNMERRLIPVLAAKSLTSMPTKQLLGRPLSLQQCEESAALSERTSGEAAASESFLFKSAAEWQKAYADVKAELATRERLPSGAERAKARQQRATRVQQACWRRRRDSASVPCAERARPAATHHGR